METITIRVYESDLKEWQRKASLRGLNMSEWVRRQCNAGSLEATPLKVESEKGNGSTNHKDVPGTRTSDVRRRRIATAGRKASRRSESGMAPAGSDAPPAGMVSDRQIAESATVPISAPVVHLATSNRLTCMCGSCSSWRKINGIPVGGLPKKEKK